MATDPSGVERHRGREAALQLLYQWEIGRLDRAGLEEAGEFYWAVNPAPDERRAFAWGLVSGTTEQIGEIDPLLEANTQNWRLTRLAVVDRLIMRMAVYELAYSDTPAAVVIDEALELARTYGGERSVPFVNGVLDSVNRTLGHLDTPTKS